MAKKKDFLTKNFVYEKKQITFVRDLTLCIGIILWTIKTNIFITMCNKQILVMKKFFRTVMAFSLAGGMLAFTGCTDYEDDINKLNDRIDALETGSIASVEEQVAALQTSLEAAETTITELNNTVDGLETSLSGLQGDVDALETEVGNLGSSVSTIEEKVAALEALKEEVASLTTAVAEIKESLDGYATKDYVDATFATQKSVAELLTRLGAAEGKLTAFETEMASLKAGLKALEDKYDSKLKISEVIAKIDAAQGAADDAQEAADKAQTDASKALGDLKVLTDALGVYAQAGAIQDALDLKMDIEDFDESFNAALQEALENEGVITNEINAKIQAATDKINARIDALVNKVDDLAGRIQSLVFVPEYSDGMATSMLYTIKHFQLSETQTVSATFQVTPKELAAQVAAQKENVFLYALPVKTRAAAESIAITGDALKLSGDPETGRIEVEALVSADLADFAIALYIADASAVKDAEENADIEGIDAGSYISSEYVQVKLDEGASELSDDYVLYNFETEKEFPEEYTEEAAWSDAPAACTFYEGYELAIKSGDEYLTLADAEKKFNLAEGSLTPKYDFKVTFNPDYYPKDGRAIVISEDKEKGYGVTAMMTVEDPQNHVGLVATVENTFSYYISDKDIPVELITNTTSYEITNKVLDVTFEAESLDWSYEVADELSSAHTAAAAYDQNITFPEVLVLDKPEGYDISQFADEIPASREVYLNGELIGSGSTIQSFNFQVVATDKGHIARVTVYTDYEFSQEKENVYKMVNTYRLKNEGSDDPAAYTEIRVTFEFTLGQMPADKTIDFGAFDIPFMTSGNYHEEPVENVDATAFAGLEAYFADQDEFSAALYDNADCDYTTVKNGKEISSKWTKLDILAEDESNVRVSSSDLDAFADEFEFTTTLATWFGIDYTFNASATIVAPEYALAPSLEYADEDYNATINGEIVEGKYVIKTTDISKYIKVINLDDIDKNAVSVKYEVLTKEDAKAGILNVPTLSVTEASVEIPTGKIETSNVEWLTQQTGSDFTARELKIQATLYIGNVELDQQVLTLTTPDPVTKFESATIEANRTPGSESTTANLWTKMILNCVAGTTNLVDNAAKSFADIFTKSKADDIYAASITFGDEVKVYVNGVEDKYYSPTKYEYDAAAGTIEFIGDDADLINPVEFEVEATLEYVLDYNHVQSRTIAVKVKFSQK